MPTSTNPKVGSEWFTSIKDIQEKVINVVFGEKKKKNTDSTIKTVLSHVLKIFMKLAI